MPFPFLAMRAPFAALAGVHGDDSGAASRPPRQTYHEDRDTASGGGAELRGAAFRCTHLSRARTAAPGGHRGACDDCGGWSCNSCPGGDRPLPMVTQRAVVGTRRKALLGGVPQHVPIDRDPILDEEVGSAA